MGVTVIIINYTRVALFKYKSSFTGHIHAVEVRPAVIEVLIMSSSYRAVTIVAVYKGVPFYTVSAVFLTSVEFQGKSYPVKRKVSLQIR